MDLMNPFKSIGCNNNILLTIWGQEVAIVSLVVHSGMLKLSKLIEIQC